MRECRPVLPAVPLNVPHRLHPPAAGGGLGSPGDLPLVSPQHSLPSCRTGSGPHEDLGGVALGWEGCGSPHTQAAGVVCGARRRRRGQRLSEEQMPPLSPLGLARTPAPPLALGPQAPHPHLGFQCLTASPPLALGWFTRASPTPRPQRPPARVARSQPPGMPVPATGTQTETHICQQRLLGLPPGWEYAQHT